MSLDDVRLVPLPVRSDERGSLSFLEAGEHVPFEIKRIFYLYGIAPGQNRGAHAHRELQQFLIPLAGSFEVRLDDGRKKATFTLDRPDQGLYMPAGIWGDLYNFSKDAVCLALASLHYSEEDYYRNYDEFKAVYGA
ncbi:sugar 3,4-ketoisomerase [Deinococcus arcticus]|uniref:WxcM-like domain-containing protein n=1 Tax=Deinococcus arcticus TaxID=2136176 RepID=A0A2T3W5R5_9DEIO|nr:FdtA/QdtA family cupin domain-containing protein [Deinococcus arcticus]PTA67134.1 WxcM-like domain-containing protein [Deinococcus arcticus]